MRGVYLNDFETGEESAASCRRKGVNNGAYFRTCQLKRGWIIFAKRQRAWSDGRPSSLSFRNQDSAFLRATQQLVRLSVQIFPFGVVTPIYRGSLTYNHFIKNASQVV